jgi:hypothetical protein
MEQLLQKFIINHSQSDKNDKVSSDSDMDSAGISLVAR